MAEEWTHSGIVVMRTDGNPNYRPVRLRAVDGAWETDDGDGYYMIDGVRFKRGATYPEPSTLLITSVVEYQRPVEVRLAEAVALLRKIEWDGGVNNGYDLGYGCAACGEYEADSHRVHKDDCALAKILRENPE